MASARNAIISGAWKLSEIFGSDVEGPPARILSLVLTWYDQHNPWLGMPGDYPECCNFRIFQYLFSESDGDLVKMHDTIRELSRIYCVARICTVREPIPGQAVGIKREIQSDILPPKELLDQMPLSKLTRVHLETLQKFPPDWGKQLHANGENPDDYRIYDFDEN